MTVTVPLKTRPWADKLAVAPLNSRNAVGAIDVYGTADDRAVPYNCNAV